MIAGHATSVTLEPIFWAALEAAAEEEALPKLAITLVGVGEEGGRLREMLGEVAVIHEEEMDRAAENSRDVRYDPQLIDATYALLLTTYGEPLVIPTLNRDGDCISDLVMQMFGSIAGAESLLISLDEEENPETVMAEAPHGTAPSLQGKDLANPMAMLLACGAVLSYADGVEGAARVRRRRTGRGAPAPA